MKAHTLIYDQSTFGITGKSLKMLRNAIIDNLRDEIIVVEIPTANILCGFLILNKTKDTATWSGDGFRTDGGGEGGRGYKAALELLEALGIRHPHQPHYPDKALNEFKEALSIEASNAMLDRALMTACNNVGENFDEDEFKCYYELIPWY